MTVESIAFPEDDPARAARVFDGALVVYRQVAALAPLLTLARDHVEAVLGGEPRTAHQRFTVGDYLDKVETLRRNWRSEGRVRALWIDILRAVGADPEQTYYDWFALRAVPPRHHFPANPRLHLPPHRDSWGSNVYQQINWWAPVFPLEAERTLVVYPDYWSRPIANTSARWDLAELRRLPPTDRKAYPRLAALAEPMGDTTPVPIVIDPGDLLCFSAQHLHASRPDAAALTRFNTECRTVNIDDVRAHRAAPNTDGGAPYVAWDWFKRFPDGRSLAADLGLPGGLVRLPSAPA
ncbi:MAG: hypothetical protein GY791_08580 [Alphaproteobacteria bacterium]|nr:hypothetical protein [Alphaproteobacteria bacterium]